MSGRKTFEILIKRLSLLSFFAVFCGLIILFFLSKSAEASTIKTPIISLGLISHWTFDGKDTVWDTATTGDATDASGNGHTGDLISMSRATTPVSGQIGQALNLDGTNDYVSVATSTDFNFGTSDFTISWWEYRTANDNGRAAIVRDTTVNYPGYLLGYSAGAADLQIYMSSNGSSWDIASAKTLGTVTLNTWNHFLVKRSGTTFTAYKNGTQTDTWTSSGSIQDGISGPMLGLYNTPQYFFKGKMDDVRMYSRAFSTTEITRLYNAGIAKIGIASSTGSLATGLVGHWTLDGKNVPWTSAIAGTALDSSGNSYTGTLTNMARTTSPTRGTVGQALSFDGSDDYVDRGTGPTSVNSVAFWVYPETTTEYFINLTSTSDYIWANAGTVTATGFTSPTIYVDGAVSSTLVANRWQHVVVTSSTSENASNLDIGRTADVNYLQGKMDDVRMYSRVITAAEIKRLYNIGRPSSITIPASSFNPAKLGGLRFWLKADAITGLSDGAAIPASGWLDQSGHNMNFKPFGTTTITYETNEINGKPAVYFHGDANGGLQTDGGEDLNDITGDFSIFAVWKLDVDYGPDMVFHKGDAATAAGSKFALLAHWNGDDRGAFNYYVGTSGANPQFTDDVHTWRQGNGVRNGSSANVRINRGEQTASATLAGTINSVTGYKATIGGLSTGTFPPTIHIAEVIFYDRAITGTNLTSIETYLFDKYGL